MFVNANNVSCNTPHDNYVFKTGTSADLLNHSTPMCQWWNYSSVLLFSLHTKSYPSEVVTYGRLNALSSLPRFVVARDYNDEAVLL
jgi:hypothetical protein